MKIALFALLLWPLAALPALGQRLAGTVRNARGERLPYASVQETATRRGTLTDAEGHYELLLSAGTHRIRFQHLNHKAQTLTLQIGPQGETLQDVTLEELSVQLPEVTVRRGEDPAYALMRRAAVMARLHRREIARWQAKAYIKGTIRVRKVPFLLENALEKAYLKTDLTYVLESVSELHFTQPNLTKETIVSVRSNLPPGTRPLINFAQLSFYDEKVGELISPFSQKAPGYYRFQYLGAFQENGLQVHQVQVIPKVRSINLFEGTLNLLEAGLSIHSLQFAFTPENGITYHLRQVYSPFEGVWMPVQMETEAAPELMGTQSRVRYVTSVQEYALTLDEAYRPVPGLLDEKSQPGAVSGPPLVYRLSDFRRHLDSLETRQRTAWLRAGIDPDLLTTYTLRVDSGARRQSGQAWQQHRLIPLTADERRGYRQADSVYRANAVRIRRDSLRALPAFRPLQLLTGKVYNYGVRPELMDYPRRLTYVSPLMGLVRGDIFNTVEGYVAKTSLLYTARRTDSLRSELGLTARYAVARRRLNAVLSGGYGSFNHFLKGSIGRDVAQFNPTGIAEGQNTSSTLLFENNYLKLYEKRFVELSLQSRLLPPLGLQLTGSVESRFLVKNNDLRVWRNLPDRVLTSNNPRNLELGDSTAFPGHKAAWLLAGLTLTPGQKTGVVNGLPFRYTGSTPAFQLNARVGQAGGQFFSQLELGVSQTFTLLKNELAWQAEAGWFPSPPQYLMDFKHFNGNRNITMTTELSRFRTLDYYLYSTARPYRQLHAMLTFRQLMLTRIEKLRLMGLREYLILHGLHTARTNVFEVGYGVRGLMRLLSVEGLVAFQNGRYQQAAVRLVTPILGDF